jgi:hypothetical protein
MTNPILSAFQIHQGEKPLLPVSGIVHPGKPSSATFCAGL